MIASIAWLPLLAAAFPAAPTPPAESHASVPEPSAGEQLFARRLDPVALDRAIDALADEAAKGPKSYRPRILLARAQSFWALLHEEATPDEASAHLEVGVRAAGEALALASPAYGRSAIAGKTLLDELAVIEPSGAEALYWLAADQHQLAASQGLAWLLLEEGELRRLFQRVLELAGGTWYGGASLHLAELDLALPTGFGAGLNPVAAELAGAARLGPAMLETHLVWAGRWAVKAQDYRVFLRELNLIRNAPTGLDPAIEPENDLTRRKAEELARSASELFTRVAIGRPDAGVR
ncbi:MAG: TRAP transporter TatT component family protein [Myxococcales bacterium]